MKDKIVKLNLGSGYNFYLPPWINVDKFITKPVNLDKRIVYVDANITDLPFDKNSVDYIVMDNVLEHMPQSEVPTVLYEIKRVLKPGGKAVIAVPDFTDLARMWIDYAATNTYDFNAHKFFSEMIYGNQVHDGEYHKVAFYPGYFNHILHTVGLHNFEVISAPRGMAVSQLKEFEGIRSNGEGVVRNAQIIVRITK